jgi:hypothetical protein
VPISIAGGVPSFGTEGSDDAGSLVNTGEEKNFGFLAARFNTSLNPDCLSNRLVNYSNHGFR